MAKNTSTADTLPLPIAAEIHPKGLLEAISYIDQNFANELGGCVIDSHFLSTKQRIEFMEVGVKSSLASGFVSAILTPIAIGVLEKHIPIFGDPSPTFFDLFAAILLALSFYIGYAIFIAKSAKCYIGEYTRSMVRNLLGGMTLGSIVKAFVIFLGFQFIYFWVLSDKHLYWCAGKLINAHLGKFKVTTAFLAKCIIWLQDFRGTLLTSANFIVLTTFVLTVIPWVSYIYAQRRNRKLQEAGLIRAEMEVF